MKMIHGIRIKLINKFENGIDEFGHPIYREEIKFVDNVLVSPATADDLPTDYNLRGKKRVYTLGIPKGDHNVWEDQDVELFGKRFHAFSPIVEGIEDMVPLRWHKKIMVESYD